MSAIAASANETTHIRRAKASPDDFALKISKSAECKLWQTDAEHAVMHPICAPYSYRSASTGFNADARFAG